MSKKIVYFVIFLSLLTAFLFLSEKLWTPFNILAIIYKEASLGDLRKVSQSNVLLKKNAADAFEKMAVTALADHVSLVPISGFRSVSYQSNLFNRYIRIFGFSHTVRVLKKPGESEHHTGLALDINDGFNPACLLESCFENTAAFEWLNKNAAIFGFYLSYPRSNSENIDFEPWHWLFQEK